MVSRSEGNFYGKRLHDILPEIGYKGIAVVTDRHLGAAEPLDPLHHGLGAVEAAGVGHRVRLEPPAGPTKGRQQEPFPI